MTLNGLGFGDPGRFCLYGIELRLAVALVVVELWSRRSLSLVVVGAGFKHTLSLPQREKSRSYSPLALTRI